MSPFFRGSVRPPRRHPRPWSMNPRLNPDLVTDDTSEKGQFINDEAEIRLPVTNNIYGKHATGFTAAVPETPATDGRHTPEYEDETLAAIPDTDGGTTEFDPAGPAFDLGGDTAVDTAHLGGDSLVRSSTRDSGTAMMDSPYLNDLADKGSSSLSAPPPGGPLGVPPSQGHARADSSTIGTAVTQGFSGAVYGTQVIEADEEEGALVDHMPTAATTGGMPSETWFAAPIGQAVGEPPTVTEAHGAYEMPGGFPGGVEEASATTTGGHSVSEGAPAFVYGSAARGEPLVDDVQIEVSEGFRPRTIIEEPEPEEPLVSDEQLEVGDEFTPQAALQGHV